MDLLFNDDDVELELVKIFTLDNVLNSKFTTLSDLWRYEGFHHETLRPNDKMFLSVYLKFSRRPQYYIYTLFLPLFLLLLLQIAGLFIDPTTPGERSAYAITNVLAFQFSLEQVSQKVPVTSQTILLLIYVNFINILASCMVAYMLITSLLAKDTWWQHKYKRWPKVTRMRSMDLAMAAFSFVSIIIASIAFYKLIE